MNDLSMVNFLTFFFLYLSIFINTVNTTMSSPEKTKRPSETDDCEEIKRPKTSPPAIPSCDSGQVLSKLSEDSNLFKITNSPYGKDRNKLYGWGNVFSKIPAQCKSKYVHIGMSSLNGVPMPGTKQTREMSKLIQVFGRKFNTLEHCATFYRLNDDSSWNSWKKMCLDISKTNFKITVKTHKMFTHDNNLLITDDIRGHLVNFIRKCRLLETALGPILIQLPPTFSKSSENIGKLKTLSNMLPSDLRFAFEFRSSSMYCDEVYDIMRENNWIIVLYHLCDEKKNFTTPFIDTCQDTAYIRLHGASQQFSGDYGPAELTKWSSFIASLAQQKKHVYIFMNNNESFVGDVRSSVVDATCISQQVNKLMSENKK